MQSLSLVVSLCCPFQCRPQPRVRRGVRKGRGLVGGDWEAQAQRTEASGNAHRTRRPNGAIIAFYNICFNLFLFIFIYLYLSINYLSNYIDISIYKLQGMLTARDVQTVHTCMYKHTPIYINIYIYIYIYIYI